MVLCYYEHTGYQRISKLRPAFSVCCAEVMKMNPSWKEGSERSATMNNVHATVQSMMTVRGLKGAAGRQAPC